MTETQWITLIETADIIKTLPTKVARMCEEGKLAYYKEGDHYFISRESIDFFIESYARCFLITYFIVIHS